mgnify:CR=1 FL=1
MIYDNSNEPRVVTAMLTSAIIEFGFLALVVPVAAAEPGAQGTIAGKAHCEWRIR